jgi:hypothetical protein
MKNIKLAIELCQHLKKCLETKQEFELRIKKSKEKNPDLKWSWDHKTKVKADMKINKKITLSEINRIRIMLNDIIKSL